METQRHTDDRYLLVREAHREQKDKCGFDYFEYHLLPVARSVPAHLYFAALAHDILEDTTATVDDLESAGFSAFEIDLIQLLTKIDDNYDEYLRRIATNPEAKIIKVMDVVNNLSRMHNIKCKDDFDRLVDKYLTALAHLRF